MNTIRKPLIRRAATALSMLMLGLALTGCVVVPVPWGGGHHGGGRDWGGDRGGHGRDAGPRR